MRWKWILAGVLGLIVLLALIVYVVLSTYDFNSLKPQIARAAKEATGRNLTLGGDISLKIGLTPALVVENARFQNAPWGSRPEMAEIKRFELHVALLPLISKRIELKRLSFVEPDILVETDKSGRSNLDFRTQKDDALKEPKEAPTKKKMDLPSLVVNEFEITKALVNYRDGRTGKTMVVSLDSLKASATDLVSPTKLKLKGSYNREPFEAEGTIGPLAGMMDSSKLWPIHLSAKAFGATLTLDGAIKDMSAQRGIDLGFAIKGNDISTLGKAAGPPLPIKGSFDISGRLSDPSPKTYRISNLKVSLGNSDLVGTVEAQVSGQRPKVTVVLSSQKLNLQAMLPDGADSGESKTGGKESSESSKGPRRDKLLPGGPLPLELLGEADAEVKFQAGQVLLPKITLENLSVDMDLKDGRLGIKPLKARMSGGILNVQLDLLSQGKTATLQSALKIEQIDLGRILKEVKGIHAVEGSLNADVNVKGHGSSVAGIMGSLDGKSVLTINKGKIPTKYLDALGGDVGSALFTMLGLSKDSQTTAVNCLVAGFNIKDGRAETTALVADTDQVSLTGDGEINLGTETLNITFNPSPKRATGTGTAGKITSGISELAKSFKMSGTFAHPSLALDTMQTATSIGKLLGGKGFFGTTESSAPSTGQELCVQATEAARKGVKLSASGRSEKKGETVPAQRPAEGIKGIGKELKKLFGK